MRSRRLRALPVVAGLLSAAAAFAAVAAITGAGDPEAVARDGDRTAAGRAVFARMGCGGCHALAAAGTEGAIGPDLDERLGGYDRASLAAKIVDPYAGSQPGAFTVMPEDFGRRMTAAELEALVAYLLASR
jgi:cytochrome c oxidase subunit 2